MASASAALILRTSPLCRPYPFSSVSTKLGRSLSIKMQGSEITEEEISKTADKAGPQKKTKVFVAGATGSTGKRIVDQLIAKRLTTLELLT